MGDGPVQSRASLHEKAVQKIARDEVNKARQRRGSSGSRSGPVTVRRWSDDLHPMLVDWVERRRIDYRRIQKVSPTEIIIWNPGAPHQ